MKFHPTKKSFEQRWIAFLKEYGPTAGESRLVLWDRLMERGELPPRSKYRLRREYEAYGSFGEETESGWIAWVEDWKDVVVDVTFNTPRDRSGKWLESSAKAVADRRMGDHHDFTTLEEYHPYDDSLEVWEIY